MEIKVHDEGEEGWDVVLLADGESLSWAFDLIADFTGDKASAFAADLEAVLRKYDHSR